MNIKEKKQRLQSFKNEVKEFHPLLDELLRKIPNIMQVEYTHGGDKEFGADFVLIAKNPIFNEIDHVGVIAKIGKILQDFRDIDKQIEECQLPRLVGNGKNEVFLNQILVVSNSTISANAQKKIHHKYRSSNIRFIDGSKLIDLIDQYLPNYWFDIKISISKYLENLWSRNDELDKKFSLLGNDKRFYIEPDIYEYASESYTHRQRTKRRKK